MRPGSLISTLPLPSFLALHSPSSASRLSRASIDCCHSNSPGDCCLVTSRGIPTTPMTRPCSSRKGRFRGHESSADPARDSKFRVSPGLAVGHDLAIVRHNLAGKIGREQVRVVVADDLGNSSGPAHERWPGSPECSVLGSSLAYTESPIPSTTVRHIASECLSAAFSSRSALSAAIRSCRSGSFPFDRPTPMTRSVRFRLRDRDRIEGWDGRGSTRTGPPTWSSNESHGIADQCEF